MKNLFRVQSSRFKGWNPEPGTWNTERATAAWALSAVLALMPAVAGAQVLNDPTRPPPGLGVGDPEAAADAGGAIMLQTVMISPTHKAAIINGVLVKLGEKYGDAVLIRVAESEVVLRSGGAQQVLKLHPGVEKREIRPTAATSTPRAGKTRSGAEPAINGGAPAR